MPTHEKKTYTVIFRITESQHAALQQRAGSGQSIHGYARNRSLGTRRTPRHEAAMATHIAQRSETALETLINLFNDNPKTPHTTDLRTAAIAQLEIVATCTEELMAFIISPLQPDAKE